MIERSPDLTFVLDFVRSFSGDLKDLILIRLSAAWYKPTAPVMLQKFDILLSQHAVMPRSRAPTHFGNFTQQLDLVHGVRTVNFNVHPYLLFSFLFLLYFIVCGACYARERIV